MTEYDTGEKYGRPWSPTEMTSLVLLMAAGCSTVSEASPKALIVLPLTD
jgi:hypothetical protein